MSLVDSNWQSAASPSESDRYKTITWALMRVRTLEANAYTQLCSALPYSRDEIHGALSALLAALLCTHSNCRCPLRKSSADVRRAVATANTQTLDETGLLARTFERWCFNFSRATKRRYHRERLSFAVVETLEDFQRSEDDDYTHSNGTPEAHVDPASARTQPFDATHDREVYRAAYWRLLALVGCTQREAEAFVALSSREGRDSEQAVPDKDRRAASVARRKLAVGLGSLGLLNRDDFEVGLGEGLFRNEPGVLEVPLLQAA